MHIHLHTETVVREGRFDSTVKNVYKRCRCGAEKHTSVVTLSNPRFRTLKITETN